MSKDEELYDEVFTPYEVSRLMDVMDIYGAEVMKLFRWQSDQATLSLRQTHLNLEEVRLLQGRIQALQDLATMLEVDMPSWHAERHRQEEAGNS